MAISLSCLVTDDSAPEKLEPGLYIVATPIGNLRDMTLRAAQTLAAADVIAVEDSRVTAKLLGALGIKRPMIPYHDHSNAAQRDQLIARMATQSVALVSDAGTPLIADPGFKLVQAAQEAGIPVTTMPGPSALITALTLAGLPTDRFFFGGFLPNKAKARDEMLAAHAAIDATLVYYEGPSRLTDCLTAMAARWPDRPIAVARELTKKFEEVRRGDAATLAAHYAAHPPKGEIVLVIGSPVATAPVDWDDAALDDLLRAALSSASPAQAAKAVAKQTGLPRADLYARAMQVK